MYKIEQGKIDWSADFSALADQYLEVKVRSNLRPKGSTNKGSGKGYGYSNGRFSSGTSGKTNLNENKPLYKLICHQWNYGTCSYGDKLCKRWHCCRMCADAGKVGEQHQASTHRGSQGRRFGRKVGGHHRSDQESVRIKMPQTRVLYHY